MKRASGSEDPVLRRAFRCGLSASVPFDIFPLFRSSPYRSQWSIYSYE